MFLIKASLVTVFLASATSALANPQGTDFPFPIGKIFKVKCTEPLGLFNGRWTRFSPTWFQWDGSFRVTEHPKRGGVELVQWMEGSLIFSDYLNDRRQMTGVSAGILVKNGHVVIEADGMSEVPTGNPYSAPTVDVYVQMEMTFAAGQHNLSNYKYTYGGSLGSEGPLKPLDCEFSE